ncbi:hypothetical protein HRF87_24330 [Bacillus sp. CRN 9]|nr:hypothetical protein [Bacillus sp. CRN 9]
MTSAVNETIAHIAGQTETQALRSRLSAIQSIPGPSFNKVTGRLTAQDLKV